MSWTAESAKDHCCGVAIATQTELMPLSYKTSDAKEGDELIDDCFRECALLLDADPEVVSTTLLLAPAWASGLQAWGDLGYWMEDFFEEEDEPVSATVDYRRVQSAAPPVRALNRLSDNSAHERAALRKQNRGSELPSELVLR